MKIRPEGIPVFFFVIILHMTGTEYERWCAEELKKLGFRNVRVTKASHDQGIDLVAEDRGIRWGFQCKYYSAPVGNDAVQQAYAGMTCYGLDRAAVLTNGTFTSSAKQLAEQTEVELWDHFAPAETSRASWILRLPALLLLIYCLYLFFQLMKDPGSAEKEMTVLAFGAIACVSLVFGAEHIGALVFAALCSLVFTAGGFLVPLLKPAAVCCAFLMILCAIRIVVFTRKRLEKNSLAQKEELKDLIEETRASLANEVRILLEDSLRQSVRVIQTDFDRNDNMHMTCRVRGSLDDLAVCEYALNQQAEFEKAPVRFFLARMDEKTFTVSLAKKG